MSVGAGRGLARWAAGGAGLVGLLAMGRLLACGQSGSHDGEPADASGVDVEAGSDAELDGVADADAESGLPEAKVEAPPGWHQWPYPPKDCALFVPDDISTVEPLIWEPCPFQPEGCTRAISPWGDDNGGWGFGATISVAVHEGSTYLRTARYLPEYWAEVLLLRGNEVIGAWRYQQGTSMCHGSPFVQADGRAATVLIRHRDTTSPWVFLGPAETLMASPERTLIYGNPGFADAPNGFAAWSSQLLVSGGNGRFSIRDLLTDDFERPWPPGIKEGFGNLEDPVPVGRAVYYWLWTYQLSSVWVREPEGIHAPVLKDDDFSYGWFATDGNDAAWIRASGQIDTYQFETSELWTSPLSPEDPTKLDAKMLSADVGPYMPPTSVGEGWVAAHVDRKDVRLFRISDGLEKRLPEVSEYGWSESMYEGLMIAGGAVWVVTHNWPGSNQVRYITRFEIDSLPSP